MLWPSCWMKIAPLPNAFTEVVGASVVKGLGKGLASAILLAAYPERYGVWNNTSEAALKQLEIWPEFDRGLTLGERHAAINDLFKRLSDELEVDFWTLDSLFWGILKKKENGETEPDIPLNEHSFRLERHFHDFLGITGRIQSWGANGKSTENLEMKKPDLNIPPTQDALISWRGIEVTPNGW